MKTLNELATHCHNEALQKGWYDKERPVTELLMLTVCEISEAVEADRKEKRCNCSSDIFDQRSKEMYLKAERYSEVVTMESCENVTFKRDIKDTFEDEIADTFIRLFDLAGHMGIDLDFHIHKKLQYNRSRPQNTVKRIDMSNETFKPSITIDQFIEMRRQYETDRLILEKSTNTLRKKLGLKPIESQTDYIIINLDETTT